VNKGKSGLYASSGVKVYKFINGKWIEVKYKVVNDVWIEVKNG